MGVSLSSVMTVRTEQKHVLYVKSFPYAKVQSAQYTYSFIHSFIHKPGTLAGIRNIVVKRQPPCLHRAYILVDNTDNKQVKKYIYI